MPAVEQTQKQWFVYMLRCKDGSLYTGITDNVKHRLAMHRSGKGAKYTKGRSPLTLHYVEACTTKGDALRRELAIKAMPTAQKRMLASPEPLDEASL